MKGVREDMEALRNTFVIAVLLSGAWLPVSANAISEDSRFSRSYVSEDVSAKFIASKIGDCVKPINEKDSFTLDDKQVTWSAVVKGLLGTGDKSDYSVNWYAPDGTVFEKLAPVAVFLNTQGIKASLLIDKEKMASRTGLWKIEVTYKDVLNDSKYFFLLEKDKKIISQLDIARLESAIAEKKDLEMQEVREIKQKMQEREKEARIAKENMIKIEEVPKTEKSAAIEEKEKMLEKERETRIAEENMLKVEKMPQAETKQNK